MQRKCSHKSDITWYIPSSVFHDQFIPFTTFFLGAKAECSFFFFLFEPENVRNMFLSCVVY